jgi:predicted nucleotidyltransferase
MSTSTSFSKLLDRIQPSVTELKKEISHFDSVRARMSEAFTVKKFLEVGSFKRGTSISGKSDIDLFVVVSRDDVKWGSGTKSSTTVLNKVKEEMTARFRNTSVHKDGPAIVVDFTDTNVDIVPAFFSRFGDKSRPLYWMPDGDGDWMETSPESHNKYLSEADAESGGKLKNVARLMKYWCNCRSPRVPLSSFHIELVLASEGTCKGVKSYAQCMRELLQLLAARECRGIHDPLKISGIVPCVKSESQQVRALASVKASREHAKSAAVYEGWNEVEAKRQWGIVFNGNFPA